MVEQDSQSFLEKVKQYESDQAAKRQGQLESRLRVALDKYEANKRAADNLDLDLTLTEVANFLRPNSAVARIDRSLIPNIGPMPTDPSYTDLLGTSRYGLNLVWRKYTLGEEYTLSVVVNNNEIGISTRHDRVNERPEMYSRSGAIWEGSQKQLHAYLFEAYLFALNGSKK